jgi:oxygen-independent coproporphyrinogen-3 oxidase
MNSNARRDLLGWLDEEVTRLGCGRLLDSGLISRVRTDLGGSHTVVTYPPLDALDRIDPSEVVEAVRPVQSINLYAHIAFCEVLCPFCHYDTAFSNISADESDSVRSYLGALASEIQIWKDLIAGSTVGSLYIGGGTPTAISTQRLISILESLEDMPRTAGFSACVETSPLTTVARDGRDKLAALVAAGVDRLSIGIQTFNSQLLRRSRGYTAEVAIEALGVLASLIDNVNIDMIQDLPDQTEAHVLDDLDCIESLKPAQVTWYILRLRPEAAWFSRYNRSALEISGPIESVRKRLLIREGMERMGYISRPGGRFVRKDTIHDQFKDIRASLGSTLLGMGVSAYSHGWGAFFRNTFSRANINGIQSYIDLLAGGSLPIETGLWIDDVERAAGSLVFGIRTGVRLPEPTPASHQYIARSARLLDRLESAGLVAADAEGRYAITKLGSIFEEEICSLFYSREVERRLINKPAPEMKAGLSALGV